MKADKFRKVLEAEWVAEGDTVRSVLGGEGLRGHLGATIGGRHVLPHRPSTPVRELDVDFSELPPPTAVVRQGHFHGDEWVHDPAVRGWLTAAAAHQLAVVCADHLAAAGPAGWFVITDQRIAVVVDSSVVPAPKDAEDTEAEQKDSGSSGFGRFLGRARSAVSAVADLSESFRAPSGPPAVTLWECRRDRFVDVRLVTKGRSSYGYMFSRNEFRDGSVLEIRTNARWP
ncbi:hypothetical protein GCM10011581_49210 [Saccharopolyspora subtropica]|uniref:Uncharacterized protein n=1 Tax=Saccharopolyspora thermophila TaxID=89367 RepID=A0A917KA19_9PSEU|nr:hypothetical protein [Saccharopolyspora subtropica]GGJ06421.1 hypothetical protein GCM10011581_49210 [Saccharopolyspora subtropica]